MLIVDDQPSCVACLRMLFLFSGFSVTCTLDGEDAVDHLRRNPSIDVLITDINRPGLDGIELLRQARAIAPDTIRIVVSGSGLAMHYDDARELADELMYKPPDVKELVGLVKRRLQERSAGQYQH
jgi:DNA-binding NtrC family response regulator